MDPRDTINRDIRVENSAYAAPKPNEIIEDSVAAVENSKAAWFQGDADPPERGAPLMDEDDAKALATQTLMLLHHARSALDRAAEAKGTEEVQEHIKEAQRHLTVLLELAQKATVEATVQAREAR